MKAGILLTFGKHQIITRMHSAVSGLVHCKHYSDNSSIYLCNFKYFLFKMRSKTFCNDMEIRNIVAIGEYPYHSRVRKIYT